jgi:hypothetical protein
MQRYWLRLQCYSFGLCTSLSPLYKTHNLSEIAPSSFFRWKGKITIPLAPSVGYAHSIYSTEGPNRVGMSSYCHMIMAAWLIITGFGLDDWIYFTLYIHKFGTTDNIAILHTFQLTAAHALGLSVFTSRILATDLLQSHCE